MLFAQSAPPPVSYSRHVAPVMALHCNGCHGDAGGFNTRTYGDLMEGGNLGKVIVPGDPDASLLVHFLDGRRGEERRMPLGGRRLSDEQITAIRRWIAEGAHEDPDTTEKYTLRLPGVRSQPLRVSFRVPSTSYVILTVSAGMHTEVGSVKVPKERGDLGQPGEWISWELRPGKDWPRRIDIELTIAYVEREPLGTELIAESPRNPGQPLACAVLTRSSRSP